MSVKATWNGDKALAAFAQNKAMGLRLAAEAVLDASNARVPFRDGELKESGKAITDGDEAAVSYDTPYAARQHEEVGWNHPNGGQAKYLETALQDTATEVGKIIAHQIGRGLK